MKVILLQDVAKIGRRFAVVDVPDGYALNRLIPSRLAEPATPGNLKQLEKRAAASAATKEADHEMFVKSLEILKDKNVVVTVEANEQGHLFQALKPVVIVAAANGMGATISESQLIIKEPIKSVGEHTIELQSGDTKAEVTVEVVTLA